MNTVVIKKNAKAKKTYNMVWLDKIIRAHKVELLDSMTWTPTYLVTVKKFDI